jgi:hypothetical protein
MIVSQSTANLKLNFTSEAIEGFLNKKALNFSNKVKYTEGVLFSKNKPLSEQKPSVFSYLFKIICFNCYQTLIFT